MGKFFIYFIFLALINRFTVSLFKFLLIPFKVAFIYYTLKQLGYNYAYILMSLNKYLNCRLNTNSKKE